MTDANRLELYRIYRYEMLESFKLHRQAFRHYLTLVIAILGATIAGILKQEANGWVSLLIFVGLTLEVYMCRLAKQMCNQAYVGALERIALSLKLEELLRIRYTRDFVKNRSKRMRAFRQDKNLLPQRWLDAATNFETAQEFVNKNLNLGVNKQMRDTFTAIQVVSTVMLAILVGTHAVQLL